MNAYHHHPSYQSNAPPPINIPQRINAVPSLYNSPIDSPITDPCPMYGAALAIVEDAVASNEFSEYGEEICSFMNHLENQTLPSNNYMATIQTDGQIDWQMRRTLVIWLIEVHKEYKLRPETLYLAINILDRYCSKEKIERATYQLLGISSLWVAAKYEENHGRVPTVKNLCYMCCDSYTEKQFLTMEIRILRVLGFELGYVTQETFIKRLVKLNEPLFKNKEIRAMARFVLELSLIDSAYLQFKPSIVAQASLLLAHQIVVGTLWNVDYEVEFCRALLMDSLMDSPKAIFQKYSDVDFCNSSQRAHMWFRAQVQQLQQLQQYPSPTTLYTSGQLTPPKDSMTGFHYDEQTVKNSYYNTHHRSNRDNSCWRN